MAIRRALTGAATILVAIFVALAVPTSQLRTVATVTTCCCPDPTRCHCPDHKPDHNKQPSIRSCHRTMHVAPQLPSFTPPMIIATVTTSPRLAHVVTITPTTLHDVRRADAPYGPS